MGFERREKIKEILLQKGVVFLKDLEKLFPEVSSMTLRRDLRYFEEMGVAVIIRGGAKAAASAPLPHEAVYSHRAALNIDNKKKIASFALSFIETGRSVFLDSGTTVMSLAQMLPDVNLSILTSGPNIALEILKKYNPTVNLIGGIINRDNLSVSGAHALSFVKSVNIDVAFLAPSGCSENNGFTCGEYTEYEVKKAIVKKANKVVVLMDSSKFGRSLPFTFASLKDIDVLISDYPFSEEYLQKAKEAGVEVILCK